MCEPEQLLQTSQEGFPPAEGWVGAESSCKPKEKRSASVLSPWQGIYRVNGVKTRVEKLCQAFENGKELVELSQASPHDISNVLKLYLRQVGGGGGQGRGDSRARPGASRASGGGSPAANRAGSCLLVTEWVRCPGWPGGGLCRKGSPRAAVLLRTPGRFQLSAPSCGSEVPAHSNTTQSAGPSLPFAAGEAAREREVAVKVAPQQCRARLASRSPLPAAPPLPSAHRSGTETQPPTHILKRGRRRGSSFSLQPRGLTLCVGGRGRLLPTSPRSREGL